jgi:hypothetical protein
MEGFTQEIKNLAQMEFVQFWRKYPDLFSDSDKDNLKNLYCAAFCNGAAAAQNLTVIGFDEIKKRWKTE